MRIKSVDDAVVNIFPLRYNACSTSQCPGTNKLEHHNVILLQYNDVILLSTSKSYTLIYLLYIFFNTNFTTSANNSGIILIDKQSTQ